MFNEKIYGYGYVKNLPINKKNGLYEYKKNVKDVKNNV